MRLSRFLELVYSNSTIWKGMMNEHQGSRRKGCYMCAETGLSHNGVCLLYSIWRMLNGSCRVSIIRGISNDVAHRTIQQGG